MTHLYLSKKEKKEKVFELPIEQAVYVPSTTGINHHIPQKQFRHRIDVVRKYLGQKFGGYTSVSATGGYYSKNKKRLVKEPVAKVVAFSTQDSYKKHARPLMYKLGTWDKKWGQESMGYELNNKLYYIGDIHKRRKR